MPQSSLLAWLSNKPATPAGSKIAESKDNSSNNNAAKLPTPPPSSHKDARNNISPANPQGTLRSGNPKPALPSNVEFRACTTADIPHLKRLNSLLLPIPYPESFYREILESPQTNNITLLAIWHDSPTTKPSTEEESRSRLIGAIRCRILDAQGLASTRPNNGSMLYLSTLVLLSPYRGHGIARSLLDVVMKRAINEYGVTTVGAHVWEANTDALEWYRKRGFVEVAKEAGYYRRLNPQGAVVVQRRVSVMDLLGD